jgi:hypothetical protein
MSSFGLLKEEVLTSLQEKYTTDKKVFQESLTKLVKALKSSKVLSELFQQYDAILKTHFDDSEYAKEYLEEAINYLRTLPFTSKEVKLLESLDRTSIAADKVDPYVKALDTLIFTSKKNIKERLEAKRLLTQKMISEDKITRHIDPRLKGVFLEILQKKIKNKMSQLNEHELQAIESFAEQDQEKLLANYIRLIDDNISAIDEQFTQHDGSSDSFVKLRQAKEALIEMKKDGKPTINNLERLLVLKEGFAR